MIHRVMIGRVGAGVCRLRLNTALWKTANVQFKPQRATFSTFSGVKDDDEDKKMPHRSSRGYSTTQGAEDRVFPITMTPDPGDGKVITERLGLVTSTSVLSRNILVDIFVAVLGIIGGPSEHYSELTSDCVLRATDGVAVAAQKMGADQCVNFRIEQNVIMNRLIFGVFIFVTAYAEAVKTAPAPEKK